MSYKSISRQPFGPRGYFLDKLMELAGLCQSSDSTKQLRTRFSLVRLEDRLVPTVIDPLLDIADPMGWAGRKVFARFVPSESTGDVEGIINWGDGSTTKIDNWDAAKEGNRIYDHVYKAIGDFTISLDGLAEEESPIKIANGNPAALVCIDPTTCEQLGILEDPIADAWAACGNYIDPGFWTPVSSGKVDPGFSTVTPPNSDPGMSLRPPADCPSPSANSPSPFSGGPVRYADGVLRMANTDLYSMNFGMPWAQTRSWSNGPGYDQSGVMGNGWVQTAFPTLVTFDDGSVAIISNGTTARFFDPTTNPDVYQERFFGRNQLTFDDGPDEFTLTTPGGVAFTFNDDGQFEGFTDPNGNVVEVDWEDGLVNYLKRGTAEDYEIWDYSYVKLSDDNMRVEAISVEYNHSKVAPQLVRYVEYDYYDGVENHGNLGDLKSVVIFDADDNRLGTQYYRYYKLSEEGGYTGGLRMVLGWDSFDRADAKYSDPMTEDNNNLLEFADLYFEYSDETRQVTLERVQGAGCSMCAGGVGVYEFEYTQSNFAPGHNIWATKTVETMPDGHQNIIYTNAYGQVMMSIAKNTDTDDEWISHFVYDGQGRVKQSAFPSGLINYNDANPMLAIMDGVRPGFQTDFQVNTYTTSDQSKSRIASDAVGNYVVVWVSAGQDGDGNGIYAQRFNSIGTPQGAEFRVNTTTTGNQSLPQVAMDAAGKFIVVWVSPDGDSTGIYAQRYDELGAPAGSEFLANTYTWSHQNWPTVACDYAGNFVITWQSYQAPDSLYGIFAQRFNAAGTAQGGVIHVNTYTTGFQVAPVVAMDEDGDFVIAWFDNSGLDGDDYGIFAQRFNAAGSPQGGEFQVNSTTTGRQAFPSVAMDGDGDFIVAWYGWVSGSEWDVFGQRYNASGSAQGSEFRVNSATVSSQYLQSIAASPNGDFVITWSDAIGDGSYHGVHGKFYLADGTAGSAFLINSYVTGSQFNQHTAVDHDGDFVVVWTSENQDGDGYGIFARPLERTFSYVRDTTGLVVQYAYGRTTSATASTPGTVAGRLASVWISNGEFGTPVKQSAFDYFQFTESGVTITPLASITGYVDEKAATPITTTYDYDFVTDTLQLYKMTITRPTVTTAQNGPNAATTEEYVVDDYNRVVWIKDAGGYITYREYDPASGAVTLRIDDVDTTSKGFSGLPSGWTKAGGRHLTSEYANDLLGRMTYSKNPLGHESYIIYNEANHEYRIYADWNTDTDAPTGPIQVYRHDRVNNYVEAFTSAMAPELNSSDLPDGSEDFGSKVGLLESLSRTHFNNAGQPIRTDAYFQLTDVKYDDAAILTGDKSATRHYETLTDYAFRGWVKRTETPNGTITRYIHDNLGRVTQVWVGTDDEPTSGYWPASTTGTNMIQVAEYEYDNGGVGDSNLTSMTAYPGGGADNRITEYLYDWRNRQVLVKAGVEGSESTSVNRPIGFTLYDNLNRAIESRTYDGDDIDFEVVATVLTDLAADDRLRSKTVSDYDNLGRVYQTYVYEIDPTDGTEGRALVSNVWYDARGFVIRSAAPGGLVQKTKYNGLGWVTDSFVTDGRDGSADYVEEYGDWDNVTNDTVYESTHYVYDDNGNVLSATSKQRFHDEAGYGELGDSDTTPYARVSYSATWYDDFSNRVTATANYGTYGGAAWSRPGSAPGRSDTVLQVDYAYDDAGRLFSITDPRGLESRTYFDALGRTTKTIQNYTGKGTIDDDYTDENKTTEFTYDGSGHLLTYKAWLDESTAELTEYVYGVVAGVDGNLINSNDLLSVVTYPDINPSGPQPAQFQYSYNQLGQRIRMEDINENIHAYGYDIVGRPIFDSVTTLGSGIDGTIERLETAYDSAGRAFLFTSRAGSSDTTTIVNQVKREFNGFGQLTKEYQELDGAVDGGTLYVGYKYSTTNNHSRLVTIKYPSGRELDYNYTSGDDQISRLTSISDGTITLEGYVYLGLGTVINRTHDEPDLNLTYIGSPGDGGDQYAGLDRFGRIIQLRWDDTNSATDAVSLQYDYDRNGNRLYTSNALDNDFDELYTADSGEYDGLNQLTEFQRGPLSGGNTQITAQTRRQTWAPDALGNFATVTTTQDTITTMQTRTHNEQNQLTQIKSVTGASTVTVNPSFDAAGNMIEDEAGRDFVYDAWNRTVAVEQVAEYGYDALGRRTSILEVVAMFPPPGPRLLYYSSQWQVIEEVQMVNFANEPPEEPAFILVPELAEQYVWSPVYVDAMVARDHFVDGVFASRQYALHDANFNVVAIADTDGDVLERYAYDPYGKFVKLEADFDPWVSGTNYNWVYLHQGGRFHAESGMYHFRNRDYSPTLMRWNRLDPIGFEADDSNIYRYVSNNPQRYQDPSGLFHGLIAWLRQLTQQGVNWCTVGNSTGRYQPPGGPSGNEHQVNTIGGKPITVVKLDNGGYWCHGLTFGGATAPGGPYSPYGNECKKILEETWKEIDCKTAQRGDIAVWYNRQNGDIVHSATFVEVKVFSNGNLDVYETYLDTKNGENNPRDPKATLASIRREYSGEMKCYKKK